MNLRRPVRTPLSASARPRPVGPTGRRPAIPTPGRPSWPPPATNEQWARLLRELVVARIIGRVVGTLDIPAKERAARGPLVASQVIGLVMARYVLELEPLASAPTGRPPTRAFLVHRLGTSRGMPIEWRQTLIRADRFALVGQLGVPASTSGLAPAPRGVLGVTPTLI